MWWSSQTLGLEEHWLLPPWEADNLSLHGNLRRFTQPSKRELSHLPSVVTKGTRLKKIIISFSEIESWFTFGPGFAKRVWPPTREWEHYPRRLLSKGASWPNLASCNGSWGFLGLSTEPEFGNDVGHTQPLVMPDSCGPVEQGHAKFSPRQGARRDTKNSPAAGRPCTHSCSDGVGKGVQELFDLKEHLPLKCGRTCFRSRQPCMWRVISANFHLGDWCTNTPESVSSPVKCLFFLLEHGVWPRWSIVVVVVVPMHSARTLTPVWRLAACCLLFLMCTDQGEIFPFVIHTRHQEVIIPFQHNFYPWQSYIQIWENLSSFYPW